MSFNTMIDTGQKPAPVTIASAYAPDREYVITEVVEEFTEQQLMTLHKKFRSKRDLYSYLNNQRKSKFSCRIVKLRAHSKFPSTA